MWRFIADHFLEFVQGRRTFCAPAHIFAQNCGLELLQIQFGIGRDRSCGSQQPQTTAKESKQMVHTPFNPVGFVEVSPNNCSD
jgi:hypothetical protein